MVVEKIVIMTELVDNVTGAVKPIQKVMRDFDKSQGKIVETTQKYTKTGEKMSSVNRKVTSGLNPFRMELLGVMFFGMMLNRAFTGLIKTSLEWMGVTELLSTTLGILFLPLAEWFLEIVLKLLEWVSGLTETQKKWISSLVLLAIAFSGFLLLFGQFGLGIQALKAAGFGGLVTRIGGIGTAANNAFGKVDTLANKVKSMARIAGAVIFFGLAIKDAAEGQFIAAIGDVLVGAGFIVGGPVGIAMGTIGIVLKLMGDEELMIDVIKIIYRIGNFISSFLKEAIMSGLSLKAFDPTQIEGFANIKRAFNIAAEQISMEDAMAGISDSVKAPITELEKLNDQMDDLTEQYEAGIIKGPEYSQKLGEIWEQIEKLHASYDLATKKVEEFNKALEETPTGGGSKGRGFWSGIGNILTPSIPGISDGIVQNGKVISTDPGDTIMASKGGFEGGGGINVTYNITGVSSPNDIKRMLEENNRSLTEEIRRSVQI